MTLKSMQVPAENAAKVEAATKQRIEAEEREKSTDTNQMAQMQQVLMDIAKQTALAI